MALKQIAVNIASFNDADAGGNNYFSGEIYEVFNLNGTLADIYSDAFGSNPINQDGISNVSDSSGEVLFFISTGNYYLSVGEKRRDFEAGDLDIVALQEKEVIQDDQILALQQGQTGGLIVFSTYALLDAYTPQNTEEERTSYKVTNDPDSSLNGYYSWVSGTTYNKDADLAIGVVADGDHDPVSGDTVYQEVVPMNNRTLALQGSHLISELTDHAVMDAVLTDDVAEFVFIPEGSIGTEKAYSSTFTGWKTPMIYSGESFQIIELRFGIEDVSDVDVSIWDENNVLVATTYGRVNQFGWHRFYFDSVISSAELSGSVFYASVTSRGIGGGARIMPPANVSWPAEERPDLNVYVSQYTSGSNVWTSITNPPNSGRPVPARFYLRDNINKGILADAVTNTARLDLIEPAVQGTTAIETDVSYDSKVASAPVTSSGSSPRTTAFAGWAADINRVVGESFNLLRLASVRRGSGVAEDEQWVFFKAYVYDIVADEYLAEGTYYVVDDPSVLELFDLEFVLKDPITGLDITLTEGTLPAVYRVGYDAYTANGSRAIVGETKGSAASYEGNSWYRLIASTPSGWGAFSGDRFVAVERYLAINPVDESGYKIKQEALPTISVPVHIPEILLPDTVYILEGLEGDIYFDNLMGEYVRKYDIDVSGNAGLHQNNRLNFPIGSSSGLNSTTIKVINNDDGEVLASATTIVNISPASNRTGENINTVVIGDSLVNAGTMTQTLLDNASTDVMDITLHGTRGSAPNLHEGRGGWSVPDYTTIGRTNYQFDVTGVVVEPNINSTTYSYGGSVFKVQEVDLVGGDGTLLCDLESGPVPTGSGALVKVFGVGDDNVTFTSVAPVSQNPFWIGGQIDFGQYQVDNSIPTLEVVLIALGINDVFGQSTDAGAINKATDYAGQLEILVSSIRAANPSCRIGIVLPTPPADQDAFGFNYGTGQYAARNKRNIFIWNQVFNDQYGSREGSLVFVVPSYVSMDSVNNYPTVTQDVNSRNTTQVIRQSNAVHPATSGYQQIGDSWFAFIKS